METQNYPKRLIEVDLPIKRISAHASREKSIRHGHISTLHIWWARRPLAACRAVICAALWPDPADPLCPDAFRNTAQHLMQKWAKNHLKLAGQESVQRFMAIQRDARILENQEILRTALLDFIADFAAWKNSSDPHYLETSRKLTQAAHESLIGLAGSRPLVVDPFTGGGSVALEALRVGADAFASDLNPVAVLLNKIMLEYLPKYQQRLSDSVKYWGNQIFSKLADELREFYPQEPDGSKTVAYIWARTITCEGPGCGAKVPLLRSLWLRKGRDKGAALELIPNNSEKKVNYKILIEPTQKAVKDGTVRRSACTCPFCGYTTAAEKVRSQLALRGGGTNDADLVAVVVQPTSTSQKIFRTACESDLEAFNKAAAKLKQLENVHDGSYSRVPNEPLPYLRSIFNINLLGIDEWGKLFNHRQNLALTTLVDLTKSAILEESKRSEWDFCLALGTCLASAIDRCADYWSSLAVWAGDFIAHTFGRQALGIIWDYAEVNGLSGSTGDFLGAIDWINRVLERECYSIPHRAQIGKNSAISSPLPDDSAQAFITDPPYYDAVPYADLSDFFYVWLKRSIGDLHPDILSDNLTPKKGEIVQLAERNKAYSFKTRTYYENLMTQAMSEGRRVLQPNGIGIVVFAHKTTEGWEAQLQAMLDAGWIVTGSWPIDTERPGRLRANNSAALASSIHLVCRPREKQDGSLLEVRIGDWRDVLTELPIRIREWLPRLSSEGIVGADAIFACLGPALEVYSRYSSVEKASGEKVSLKEYLEEVWAAVSREALTMIFEGAETIGFEEDARLTAMWLWTLRTSINGDGSTDLEDFDDDDNDNAKSGIVSGYGMEYDAARKIAQGLGAHLENLGQILEIKGSTATLLPVSARTKYLFGKESSRPLPARKTKTAKQLRFDRKGEIINIEQELDENWERDLAGSVGKTVLDRVHQSMILFGAGRGEALKQFLLREGVGRDPLFWRLAQALSALYPSGSEEKRWVDGVLARKKSYGL